MTRPLGLFPVEQNRRNEAQAVHRAAEAARDAAHLAWMTAYALEPDSRATAAAKRLYRLKVDEADRAETLAGIAALTLEQLRNDRMARLKRERRRAAA